MDDAQALSVLSCEKRRVFLLLMFIGGFYGAYTYLVKGGVFCNAQTGNFLLFSLALGQGKFKDAAYYLLPMASYLGGTIVSEILPSPIKHHFILRWDTILIAIEMIVVLVIGFLPPSLPVQISQLGICFICSMQFNTFRQARGIPMATTFCTNHVRQLGISIVKVCKHPENKHFKTKLLAHLGMLGCFTLGGAISSFCCVYLKEKALLVALIPLSIILGYLIYADVFIERELHDQVPLGH